MPLPDLLLEVLVGGGDDAHVHGDGGRPAHRLDLLLLQDAQHLGLRLQGHVADLVEEQRAAVRELELPLLGRERAREGAARVAEELALDQLLGNGRAVDLHEGAGGAEAQVVDVPRDELLARAVLAEDQHAPVGGSGLRDVGAQRVEDGALPDHDPAMLDLLLEGAVLRLELALAQGVLDHEQRLLEGQRLLDEVLGAHAHGLDRGLDGAVAGDDDHRHFGIERADAGQDLEPVHAGQPHVEEEEVVAAVLQRRERRLPALHRLHRVALVAQDADEGAAHARFVVYDQDRLTHVWSHSTSV